MRMNYNDVWETNQDASTNQIIWFNKLDVTIGDRILRLKK